MISGGLKDFANSSRLSRLHESEILILEAVACGNSCTVPYIATIHQSSFKAGGNAWCDAEDSTQQTSMATITHRVGTRT